MHRVPAAVAVAATFHGATMTVANQITDDRHGRRRDALLFYRLGRSGWAGKTLRPTDGRTAKIVAAQYACWFLILSARRPISASGTATIPLVFFSSLPYWTVFFLPYFTLTEYLGFRSISFSISPLFRIGSLAKPNWVVKPWVFKGNNTAVGVGSTSMHCLNSLHPAKSYEKYDTVTLKTIAKVSCSFPVFLVYPSDTKTIHSPGTFHGCSWALLGSI